MGNVRQETVVRERQRASVCAPYVTNSVGGVIITNLLVVIRGGREARAFAVTFREVVAMATAGSADRRGCCASESRRAAGRLSATRAAATATAAAVAADTRRDCRGYPTRSPSPRHAADLSAGNSRENFRCMKINLRCSGKLRTVKILAVISLM